MTEVEPQSVLFETGTSERPLSHMRVWFGIFLAWVTLLALIGNHSQELSNWFGDTGVFVGVVALAALYLSFCNTLVPLPTAWTVMLVSSGAFSDPGSNVIQVLLISLVGGAATTMANLNEYHILSHPVGTRLRDKVRRTTAYQWSVRWFDACPFWALVFVAFIPLPIDAIRWLAILRRYSRKWFAIAYWVGRSSRYLLLASLAAIAQLNWWEILGIQAGIVVVSFLAWRAIKIVNQHKPLVCEDSQ